MRLFSEPDKYYKIVASDFGSFLVHHYTKGLNQYEFDYDEDPEKGIDGLYFANVKYIFAYLNYGSVLLEAAFPDGTRLSVVSEEDGGYRNPSICVDKCVIINAYPLAGNPGIFQRLINEGADISALDYNVYKWAYKNCSATWNMLNTIYGTPDSIVEWLFHYHGY